MLEFEDRDIGKVVIFEDEDIVENEFSSNPISFISVEKRHYAHVIAYRNVAKGEVRIFKNRHRSPDDRFMKRAILNFDINKETIELFGDRLKFLDL